MKGKIIKISPCPMAWAKYRVTKLIFDDDGDYIEYHDVSNLSLEAFEKDGYIIDLGNCNVASSAI